MSKSFRKLLALTLVLGFSVACGVFDDAEPTVIIDEEPENAGNNDTNGNTETGPESNSNNNNHETNNNNENNNNENNNNENNNNENNNNESNQPAGPSNDGSACEQDSDCISNTCLTGPDWPNGYCTTASCESFEDCANTDYDENKCLINNQGGTNFCIRMCDPNAAESCRDQYRCQAFQGGVEGWCAPNPDSGGGGITDPSGGDPDGFPFPVQCESTSNSQVTIDYEISSATSSYMVVPITGDGGALWPLSISTPSGQTISFQGANAFQATGAQLFGFTNPTVIPAIPQLDGQFETGLHSYTFHTDDTEICYYVIENTGTPTTIDINLYLVGLSALNASNADSHNNLQQVLNQAENLLSQAGISFGQIRYFDVPAEAEQNFSVIHSDNEVSHLVSYSEAPGSDADSMVSANIFIVQQFAMGGALGISLGIPGAAGLHGSGISGVALTGEYIGASTGGGSGNQFTANILTHELGHFLGLFHTSEQGGQMHDPLDDTPECTNFSNPTACPDWGNLMFPSAAFGNTEITPGQAYMIHSNPLTK